MTIQRPLALLEMRLGQFDVVIERAIFGEQSDWLAVQDEFDLVISDYVMPHASWRRCILRRNSPPKRKNQSRAGHHADRSKFV